MTDEQQSLHLYKQALLSFLCLITAVPRSIGLKNRVSLRYMTVTRTAGMRERVAGVRERDVAPTGRIDGAFPPVSGSAFSEYVPGLPVILSAP